MLKLLESFAALRKRPPVTDSPGFKKQGDLLLSQDRYAEAADCYRQAIAGKPDYLEALIGLGFALSELQQRGEARQHLQQALAIDPGHADAHYVLGTLAQIEGDHAGAIEHFRQATIRNPQLEAAHRFLVAELSLVGDFNQAQQAAERALALFPDSAEFWFLLARVHAQKKDFAPALEGYRKTIALQPGALAAHINLAQVLTELRQTDPAIEHYKMALAIQPASFEAHTGLGLAYQQAGSHDEALACFRQAAELQPDDAPTQLRLGGALEARGRLAEAVACYRRATRLRPDHATAHQSLGNAYLAQGLTAEAIASFEEVVRLQPESPVRHLIESLQGRTTERAPSAYVEQLFDEYADKFDSHLVKELKYSVPEHLARQLRALAGTGDKPWTMLDLGCGTGLLGVELAPLAGRLVGVDISSKMLEKAAALRLYQRLEHMDLLPMMAQEAAASYDLVAATDVFVYLGRLDELVAEARRILNPGGLFAFSVESLDALQHAEGEAFHLNASGRYAHSRDYLARLATQCGFEILSTHEMAHRMDKGKPIWGYLTIWRRR